MSLKNKSIEIILKKPEHSDILPNIFSLLNSIDESKLYHKQYEGLRHPLGIYNISFYNVVSKISDFLAELDVIEKNRPFLDKKSSDWHKKLLTYLDQMLDALIEHMDDCENIIKCFCEKGSKTLKNVKENYDKKIKSYRDHLGKIVNKIKHEHARLRIICGYNNLDICLGYFVEGVVSDETLGPHPHIHKGSNSAFSFNRDLALHICGIYMISSALSETIAEITQINPKKFLVKNAIDTDNWLSILRKISARPLTFFEAEVSKDLPFIKVVVSPNGFIDKMLISYPSNRIVKPKAFYGQFTVLFQGDGVSTAFKLPYR